MRRLIISEQDGVLFNSPFNSTMCFTYQVYTKEIRRMVKQQGDGFWIQFVTSFRSYAVSNHGTDDISVPMAEDAFIDMLRMLSSNDNLQQLSDLVRSLKALNLALMEKDFDIVMNPMLRYLFTRFSKPFYTIKLYFRFFASFMTLFHRWEVSRRARSTSPLARWIPPVHWTDIILFRNYGRSEFERFLKVGWGRMLPKLLRLTSSEICWLEPQGDVQQKSRRKKRHCRKMKAQASQGKDNVLPKTSRNTGNNAGSTSTKSEGPEVSVENSSGAMGKVHPHQPSVNKKKMSCKEKNDLNRMDIVSEPSRHFEGDPCGEKANSTKVKKGNNKKVDKLDEKCVKEASLQNASGNDVTKNKASDSSESQHKCTLKSTSHNNGNATLDVNSNITCNNKQGKNPIPCKDHASKTSQQSSDEVKKQPVKSTSQPSADCGKRKRKSRIFTRSKAFQCSNSESVLANKVCNLTNGITTNVTETRVEEVHRNENITASNLVSASDSKNPRTLYPDDVNNNVDRKNTVGWCNETRCSGKEPSNQKDSRNCHTKISPSLCSETVSNDKSKLKKPLCTDNGPRSSPVSCAETLSSDKSKPRKPLCTDSGPRSSPVSCAETLSSDKSKPKKPLCTDSGPRSSPVSCAETHSSDKSKPKKPLCTDSGPRSSPVSCAETHSSDKSKPKKPLYTDSGPRSSPVSCAETLSSDKSKPKKPLCTDSGPRSSPVSCAETLSSDKSKLKKPLCTDSGPRSSPVSCAETLSSDKSKLKKPLCTDSGPRSSPVSCAETLSSDKSKLKKPLCTDSGPRSSPASCTETVSSDKSKPRKPLCTDNGCHTRGIPSENVSQKNTVGSCKETVCSTKELSDQRAKLDRAKTNHSSPASRTETISQTKLKKPLCVDESNTPKITSVNVLQDKGDTVGRDGEFLGKADNKRSFSNDNHDGSSPLSETKHESVSGYLSKDCSSKGKGTLKKDEKGEAIVNEASAYQTLYHGHEQKAQLTSKNTGEEDSSLLSRKDAIEKHVDAHTSGKEYSRVSSADSCNEARVKSETKNEIIKDNDFKESSSSTAHKPGKQSNSVFENVKVPSNKIKDFVSIKNGEETPQKRTIGNSDSFSKKGSTSPAPKGQPEDPCPKEKVHSQGSSYGRPLPPPRFREKIYLCRKCDSCNILEHTPGLYRRCSWCIRERAKKPKVYCGTQCQYVDWVRVHKKEHKSS